MARVLLGLLLGLTLSGGIITAADDPPGKLTPELRKELETKWKELTAAGEKAVDARNHQEAEKALRAALEVVRRLHPKDEFPDGHPDVEGTLSNLAFVLEAQRKYAEAEPFYREALAMSKRLFKGDHPEVATNLRALANTCKLQGKLTDAEPLLRDVLAMRKRLFKGDHPDVARSMGELAIVLYNQGKLADAELQFRDALAMRQRLFKGDHLDVANSLHNLANLNQDLGKYEEAELQFRKSLAMLKTLLRGDHPYLVQSLNNLGSLLKAQGKYADAEPLFRDSLDMSRRLFKGDHPYLATSMNAMGFMLDAMGKYTDAEPLYRDALDVRKRLFKGDHADVAESLNNLGSLLRRQGRYAEAEILSREALEMRKRLFKGDHPEVVNALNNLAKLHQAQGKYAEAEQLYRDALDVLRRLFKGDHPEVASTLNNVANVLLAQGKYAEARTLARESLDTYKRFFKSDHPDVVFSLYNLACNFQLQGKYADAEANFHDALKMNGRLIQSFARRKAEGNALTLLASLPSTRDAFLSNARQAESDPDTVYVGVWTSKGLIARTYEQRQLAARAASADPKAAKLLTELAGARRRRAELLLAPQVKDPTTRQKREQELKELETTIDNLDREVGPLLPAIARADRLNEATPAELQKVLPSSVAVVDFLRYVHFEYDKNKPGKAGEMRTARYLAFVVTRDKITWVDLETAEKVESAVDAWREAMTTGKEIPAAIPATVRERVWEKVRRELPASIKTVYLCPDATLCRMPWPAIPGDKPGTILLEDFAIATIPHATFLLDKLWPQDALKNPPTSALVVGGVKYDAELTPSGGSTVATRGNPLVKPDARLGWSFLPGTIGELNGVSAAAERKKLTATHIEGDRATPPTILAALPQAKYAHFATHGFFADPSFRSVFQLDEKDYEQSRLGERIGRAANSPMVMTGLVFAGANNPKTPGRGILTGEALIDLDLSGLELAVLSACETGLGDVAGGEGTFGLQRAFHLAGTRDVVASLWKVPDQPTAALMALFYRNLWDKNLSPVESLRQAQLEIYRNPTKIPDLARGFRGKFEEVPGSGDVASSPGKDGKAHPLLWAAFTLSGPGR